MDEDDRQFVERFADVLAQSGWPRMSARVFGVLMISDDGSCSAAELSAQLAVGGSAISNGAKMLRTLGLVDVTRRSDRQIVYEVRPDAWMEAVAHQDQHLRTLENILKQGADSSTGSAAARLTETSEFFAFLRAELPGLVHRWRAARQEGSG